MDSAYKREPDSEALAGLKLMGCSVVNLVQMSITSNVIQGLISNQISSPVTFER